MTPKEYYKAKIDAITEVRRRGHYLPETLKQLGMDEEHLMEYTRLYSKECEKEEREAHLHDFFIYEYGMSEEEYQQLTPRQKLSKWLWAHDIINYTDDILEVVRAAYRVELEDRKEASK